MSEAHQASAAVSKNDKPPPLRSWNDPECDRIDRDYELLKSDMYTRQSEYLGRLGLSLATADSALIPAVIHHDYSGVETRRLFQKRLSKIMRIVLG